MAHHGLEASVVVRPLVEVDLVVLAVAALVAVALVVAGSIA